MTPYKQGYAAHEAGQRLTANPFIWGIVEQAEWARGHRDAEVIRQKAKEWRDAHPPVKGTVDDDIPF